MTVTSAVGLAYAPYPGLRLLPTGRKAPDLRLPQLTDPLVYLNFSVYDDAVLQFFLLAMEFIARRTVANQKFAIL